MRYTPDYRPRRARIFELRKARRFEEALREVEAMEAEGAHTPDLRVDRADLLARLNRPTEALEVLEDARREFPLSTYGRALLAGLLDHAGRGDEARLLFDELAREERLDPATLARVTRHLRERGEDERALALVRRVADAAADPRGARSVADALEKAGQHDQAVEVLRRAVRAFPDDAALFEHFALLRLKGLEPDLVVEELDTLLSLPGRGRSRTLRGRLGTALRAAGDLARAREVLQECVEEDPRDPFLLGHLGYTLRDLKEYDRAAEVLERVLELNLSDAFARRAYFAACREAGQAERARQFVREQTAKDRRRGFLWNDLRSAGLSGPRTDSTDGG